MAQVTHFSVIGRCVVDLGSEAESIGDPHTETSDQVVGLFLLLTETFRVNLDNVEEVVIGIDKVGTGHIFPYEVVV